MPSLTLPSRPPVRQSLESHNFTLDVGAYRFSPDMHLPGDLIMKQLRLPTHCYEPGAHVCLYACLHVLCMDSFRPLHALAFFLRFDSSFRYPTPGYPSAKKSMRDYTRALPNQTWHFEIKQGRLPSGCQSAKEDVPKPFIFNYSAPLRRPSSFDLPPPSVDPRPLI